MEFADARGFTSADEFLDSISVSDWMELAEWVSIRGPVGAARMDYYVSFLALHAGRQYDDKVTVENLLAALLKDMPYVKDVRLEED